MHTRSVWVFVALVVGALSVPARALDAKRPVVGTLDGYDEYGSSCGGGTGITITAFGRGQIAHFGAAALVSAACVTPAYDVVGTWTFTITAANGDAVSGEVTDWAFTEYGFDLFGTITGGTGRFTGATGELTFPTFTSEAGPWSEEVLGWISY